MISTQSDPERVAGTPILTRDPNEASPNFTRGAEIPEDLDPLADGILMLHQKEWLEDRGDLKLAEKGRRTGITFAEALDDTLIAASSREAGGDNVFYIGDTKDKGREFIGYVGHFAKTVQKEMVGIEESFFEDVDADGNTKKISSYVARFASGFRVEALSSRPENIRGLQGIVVIDEAAFHKDVRNVIDAVNALLIWGGKIRIISTHSGVLNAFNELIREALTDAAKGKPTWSIHHIPFASAVKNGLFKRVCMIKGKVWSEEAQQKWEDKIRSAYGSRKAAMRQELDAIPAESEGQALSRVQVEACMEAGIPYIRWQVEDNFRDLPDSKRQDRLDQFLQRELLPVLKLLPKNLQHVYGQDFARKGDASAIDVKSIEPSLVRKTRLAVEMRNVPFDEQRKVMEFIISHLPRFAGGAFDATGNGAYLAEKAVQKFGASIREVHFSESWYRENMPAYIEAFGSNKSLILPRHDDIVKDHQALSFVNGIIKVPQDFRFKGTDGNNRHGDYAIASVLGFWVSFQDIAEYDYMSASTVARTTMQAPKDDDTQSANTFSRGSIFGKLKGLW
ncbi:Mu-like prophage FluMu protein gp28 [Pseudovibrio sp. Tun.PSC04-5.I4]|nr:Mu-like prophage FluMu protein gp28 [Pseudovibrio sp. Tun.PSC04-5.I4]